MFRYSNLTGSAKAEIRMRKLVNRKEGRRSLGSVTKSLVAVGATSALMLAGLAFVAASPASAAGVLTFGGSSFSIIAGTAFGFTVTAASAGDTVNVTSSCPITAGITTQTPGGDVATFSGLVIQVGTSCTLTANTSAGPDNPSTGSQVFTVTAAAPSKLIFTPEPMTAVTSGANFSAKVSIEDQYGNVETSLSDTLSVTSASAGCSVAGTDGNIAASSGVTTFTAINITVASAANCVLTATDTQSGDTGLTAATSTAIAVATNTAAELGFTPEPPTTASSGMVLPSFAVSVEESNGIPLTTGVSATDVISLTSTCTLTGTTTATAVAGDATFTAVTIKTGATCTLVATDSTRIIATATSTAITVLPGAATQVAFTTAPPTSVTTPSTVLTAFKASVEDVNGNVVTSGTGATDTIAITSPCTLGGTTTAGAVAGVATFSALTINVTGACVLTATDSVRTLTAATATTTVGTPQAALVLSTVKGTVGKALNLATTGGTGTGALSYTVAAGSSAGCTVSGTSLSAKRAGTCLVTATKAGSTTYIVVSSAATRVTFVLPFKATRVAGTVTVGRTSTVTIVGSGFSGRPRIICNVAGVTARVAGDSGRTLRVIVTVRAGVKTGLHTFTVILANGKRTSVKFSLR